MFSLGVTTLIKGMPYWESNNIFFLGDLLEGEDDSLREEEVIFFEDKELFFFSSAIGGGLGATSCQPGAVVPAWWEKEEDCGASI